MADSSISKNPLTKPPDELTNESSTQEPKHQDNEPQPKKKGKIGKIALISIAALFAIGIIGSLIPCSHEWTEATCTEPKTCEKCGETEGGALGHRWIDATCTEPKTCSRCSETQGAALGHLIIDWTIDTQPTCTQAGSQHGTCARCGKTVTESIPTVAHTEGEWVVTSEPIVNSDGSVIPGSKSLTCSVCGATIRTESITITVTLSQQNALRTAHSYLDFTAFSHSGLIEQLEYEGYSTEDATFAADYCGADWNEQAAKSAQSYLDFMGFSRSGLIDQLMYEGFTREQAEYGVTAVGL